MFDTLINMFSYAFMQRALIGGLLISICASILGVSLVLKKNSMIGDGLSHVGFGAIAIATVLGFAPVYFTIPVVIIASYFILKLDEHSKIHGDAAIALLAASSLAIGIFVISVTSGVNTDLNNYLFGSILSMGTDDLVLSVILALMVGFLFIFCYNKIFALTFDEKFAKSTGVNTSFYNGVIAVLCSVTIVLGMQMMGALLISSLIIFPALSSMQVFKTFKVVIISSAVISSFCFITGLIISFIFETPTGSSIVLVNLVMFIIMKCISVLKE